MNHGKIRENYYQCPIGGPQAEDILLGEQPHPRFYASPPLKGFFFLRSNFPPFNAPRQPCHSQDVTAKCGRIVILI